MKKANIITLDGYKNYGNRLQNYALTKVLLSLDVKASTPWRDGLKCRIKTFIKTRTPASLLYKKERKLSKFTRTYNNRKIYNKNGDYTIFGSDQIWNPEGRRFCILNPYQHTKAISYAASVGTEKISRKEMAVFKEGLKDIKSISVREESTVELLQPLTDKKVNRVLDPTLLVNAEEWAKLEKKPKNLGDNSKYILCYILGNHEHMAMIDEYAERNGLQVIIFSDKRDSSYGVEEFIYLIHHARLICTDSFHAAVFSFIFEKQFLIFRRTGELNKMYVRLKDFIAMFGLEANEYTDGGIVTSQLRADYTKAKAILEAERKRSISFLKEALEIKDEN